MYFSLMFFREALFYDPELFNQYFSVILPQELYATRNKSFVLPLVRTERGKKIYCFKGIHYFNNSPTNLKKTMFKFRFKKLFKCFALHKYSEEYE